MRQWTRVENNNDVFLQVTDHTGQAEKNLLGPAGIRTRDLRFTSPSVGRGFESQPGQVDFSLLVRYGSSLGETPHYYLYWNSPILKFAYIEIRLYWNSPILKFAYIEIRLYWNSPILKFAYIEIRLYWNSPILKFAYIEIRLYWNSPILKFAYIEIRLYWNSPILKQTKHNLRAFFPHVFSQVCSTERGTFRTEVLRVRTHTKVSSTVQYFQQYLKQSFPFGGEFLFDFHRTEDSVHVAFDLCTTNNKPEQTL